MSPNSRLAAQIEAWRDRLIEHDIDVDVAREGVDQAVDTLRRAVRVRDRDAADLQRLVDQAQDAEQPC